MRAGRRHAWGITALLVLLSALFLGVPAAQAAFTARAQSGFMASTLVLASPAFTVAKDCNPVGSSGKFRPTITVTQYGTVPRANAYALIVKDPSGTVSVVDLAVQTSYSSPQVYGGTWTYYVQAQYKVPGTTNVWTSRTAVPASITC